MKLKKYLLPLFILGLIFLLGVYIMENIVVEAKDSDRITIVLNEKKFNLEKSFLFADRLKGGEKKIKDFARVDYFSFDFSFPSLNPISSKSDSDVVLGWGDRISVYVSGSSSFDFKERTERRDMFPVDAEEEFDTRQVLKFEKKVLREKESTGDEDVYIFGDYEIYMACDKENAKSSPKFPSCKLMTDYKGLEVSATFSSDLKYQFVGIKDAIFSLLEKFSIDGEK